MNPLVTVLLPVYNAEEYIFDSIQSILQQTYTNFELLVFNDCSTDDSLSIIQSFNDSRITIINADVNSGYITHLNNGIKLAKGKYIARMDADDISRPQRFEKQIRFMETNPTIGVCGTWVTSFGKSQTPLLWEQPISHDQIIHRHFFFDSALAHPSVMIKTEVLTKNSISYDTKLIPSEDFDLWVRLTQICKLHNLPEALLDYRVHENQISKTKEQRRFEIIKQIQFYQLTEFLDINPTENEMNIHFILSRKDFKKLHSRVLETEKWLIKLIDHNKSISFFEQKEFKRTIGWIWYMTCTSNCRKQGIKIYKIYSSSLLKNLHPISLLTQLKFIIKGIV